MRRFVAVFFLVSLLHVILTYSVVCLCRYQCYQWATRDVILLSLADLSTSYDNIFHTYYTRSAESAAESYHNHHHHEFIIFFFIMSQYVYCLKHTRVM